MKMKVKYLSEFGEYVESISVHMKNMMDSGLCAVQENVSKYEESLKTYSENTQKAFHHIWRIRCILIIR
jgi:hypothetical protein